MSGHDLVQFSRVYWWEEWRVGKEIEKKDGGRVGLVKESVVGGVGRGEEWWWEV